MLKINKVGPEQHRKFSQKKNIFFLRLILLLFVLYKYRWMAKRIGMPANVGETN